MNFNIEVRKKQLQSLDQYITSSRDKVMSILSYLGWNAKEVVKTEDKITCPINQIHRIPTENVDQHVQKCCLKTSGYQLDEQFLSEPLLNSESSILLDTPKKIEILTASRQGNSKFIPGWNGIDSDPMTSDRLFSTFSADERLALYDYSVKNTIPPPISSEFDINIPDKEDKKEECLTEEERLLKERDAKRRKVKYKSVHTGRNRSYTEVIRDVIGNQMELYEDYLHGIEERNKLEAIKLEAIKIEAIKLEAIKLEASKHQEESNEHNGLTDTLDYSHSSIFDSQQNIPKDDYYYFHADRQPPLEKRVSSQRRSRDRDRHREYKEKSYSHKRYKSSYDKPYERHESYYRPRYRH